MEQQERTWRGDGYGERTVDGVHVLANCHVDSSGVVAWHAHVWRSNEPTEPVEYWVESGIFRKFLGAHYFPPDGGPNQFVIGDVVHPGRAERDAVLAALNLLDNARLSPGRR
jgi:hypothetical protein